MWERADLAAGEDVAGAELALVVLDLLPDRLGTADDREDARFDVGPSLLHGEELLLLLVEGRRRLRRRVTRRRQADPLQQVLDEVPQVRLELRPRLGIGLRDVHRYSPAHLLRVRLVSGPAARLAELR